MVTFAYFTYAKVGKMFSRWFARRATYNQLSRMNDRELADIGINRCDIKRLVSKM